MYLRRVWGPQAPPDVALRLKVGVPTGSVRNSLEWPSNIPGRRLLGKKNNKFVKKVQLCEGQVQVAFKLPSRLHIGRTARQGWSSYCF